MKRSLSGTVTNYLRYVRLDFALLYTPYRRKSIFRANISHDVRTDRQSAGLRPSLFQIRQVAVRRNCLTF